MGRTEKEIVIPEHTEIMYEYTCDKCGKDMSDDPLDLNGCLVCGKEVCGDCSCSVLDRTHGENITIWDLQCGASHVCTDCMNVGHGYVKELYMIDDAHASAVDVVIKKWKDDVLTVEDQRTGD